MDFNANCNDMRDASKGWSDTQGHSSVFMSIDRTVQESRYIVGIDTNSYPFAPYFILHSVLLEQTLRHQPSMCTPLTVPSVLLCL